MRYNDDLKRSRKLIYLHRFHDPRTMSHVNLDHSMLTSIYDEQLAHSITELVEAARADTAQHCSNLATEVLRLQGEITRAEADLEHWQREALR